MSQNTKQINRLKPIVLIAVAVAVLLLLYRQGKPSSSEMNRRQVGSVTHKVVLSSAGKDIVAYDLMLKYDPATTQVGEITSLVSDFDVVQKTAAPGILSVTVIKLPTVKSGTVFDHTEALRIPTTYSAPSNTGVSIIEQYQNSTTKMISSDLDIIRPNDDQASFLLVE